MDRSNGRLRGTASLAGFTKQPDADYIIGKRNRFHVRCGLVYGCLAHRAKQPRRRHGGFDPA
jgi:hypothetical protein